ncbi:hypothetical protein I6F34_00780 [Bradyrhizobium sp. BRP05]|nr:hypothetical protein [Bradyrhizobium sp. BRP05]
MKIEGHVLEVMDMGDKLHVKGQGRAVSAAEWQPWMPIAISVPMTDRNRKAFYVGRDIEITVRPC